MTAKPDDEDDVVEPNLDAVGDSHMPEDLRRAHREEAAERERSAQREGRAGGGADAEAQDEG